MTKEQHTMRRKISKLRRLAREVRNAAIIANAYLATAKESDHATRMFSKDVRAIAEALLGMTITLDLMASATAQEDDRNG